MAESPYENFSRVALESITLEDLNSFHKENKILVNGVATNLRTLLIKRMRTGNLPQMKEWWKTNVPHSLEIKPQSLDQMCKYVVILCILADPFGPTPYNKLVIPRRWRNS